jgi:large subunit ribosomal protein L10
LAISKERKKELVTQYKELLSANPGLIMMAYSGLRMQELESLRRKIREIGGELHVVKNNLVKLAFQELDYHLPVGALEGPTAIGFASDDLLLVAKAIVDLSRETEFVYVKGGVLNGVTYDASQVRQLADLPPLPVVQAQLLSVLQASATRLSGVVAGSLRQLVNVFNAYAEKEPAEA